MYMLIVILKNCFFDFERYTKCFHYKYFKKLANLTRKKVTQFEDFNVPLNQNNITNSFFVHLKSCLLDFPKHL